MRPDDARLEDMQRACQRIGQYLEGLTRERFLTDVKSQDAVMRQLTILGEATKYLSREFRDSHPEVAWHDVAGLRDLLVHAYHRVSEERVWIIAESEVPALLAFIDSVLPDFEE